MYVRMFIIMEFPMHFYSQNFKDKFQLQSNMTKKSKLEETINQHILKKQLKEKYVYCMYYVLLGNNHTLKTVIRFLGRWVSTQVKTNLMISDAPAGKQVGRSKIAPKNLTSYVLTYLKNVDVPLAIRKSSSTAPTHIGPRVIHSESIRPLSLLYSRFRLSRKSILFDV